MELIKAIRASEPVLEVTCDDRVGIVNANPQHALDVNGTINGTLVTPRNRRWKQDIHPIAGAFETVTQLDGVAYSRKNGEFPGRNFPKGEQSA